MPNLALPGNPRYQPKDLQEHFGYDNLYKAVAEVEIATLETLAEIGIIPTEDFTLFTSDMRTALLAITSTEVERVEKTDTSEFGKKTGHDIRAWVRIAQSKLPPQLRRWVHVPLTSYDVLDTARMLQFRRAHYEVVQPLVQKLLLTLAKKVRGYARTVQIGRTHGQHALPITVGFWLATLLRRINVNAHEMDMYAGDLRGKISGAVGAHNAEVGLGIAEKSAPDSFESLVLRKLVLEPAVISTQILSPEPLAYYLFSATMLSAALGQLGRDCRNLMRTEIAEIGEPFETGQVGSSTMAHKRNPVNFENVESTWLKNRNEFGKVLDTLISEHQRDLTGSAIARDFPTIVVNAVNQLNTLLRKGEDGRSFLERVSVDAVACERNFASQSQLILAEPMYIALQMAGYTGDAHEAVNHHAVPLVEQGKATDLVNAIAQLAVNDDALANAVLNVPQEVQDLLQHPEKYIGIAADKALEIASLAEMY